MIDLSKNFVNFLEVFHKKKKEIYIDQSFDELLQEDSLVPTNPPGSIPRLFNNPSPSSAKYTLPYVFVTLKAKRKARGWIISIQARLDESVPSHAGGTRRNNPRERARLDCASCILLSVSLSPLHRQSFRSTSPFLRCNRGSGGSTTK